MTINLELNPEIEAGLLAHAQARGLSLEDFVSRSTVEGLAPETGTLGGFPRHNASMHSKS